MYTNSEALEAIEARLNGVWDNPQLMKIGQLSVHSETDISYILKNTDKSKVNDFDTNQIQALLDNNEQYDILLFVQIPETYFQPSLKEYMQLKAKQHGKDGEFMFMVTNLEDAIEYFDRWKDKSIIEQCKKLLNDLSAVQYIHVIK